MPGRRKGFKKPIFGYKSRRFQSIGVHPQLLRSVRNRRSPCDYDPKAITCIRKPNVHGWQPWKIATEAQEFSRNLGFEHADILKLHQFMRKHLGPGTHEINDDVLKQQPPSKCLNQNFGKQKRFPSFANDSPGPARYNVKPYAPQVFHDQTNVRHEIRFKEIENRWTLSCNRYKPKDPKSIDALVNRIVSLRGPYDLFTGPRDPTNLFSKFAPPRRFTPDKFYAFPSELDVLLRDPVNARKGQFLQAQRFPKKPTCRHMLNDVSFTYHDPRWPGPDTYPIKPSITACPEQLYAFGLTGLEVRPKEIWKISPGPGRYNIGPIKCGSTYRKNKTSVFISKTKRTEYKAQEYNAF